MFFNAQIVSQVRQLKNWLTTKVVFLGTNFQIVSQLAKLGNISNSIPKIFLFHRYNEKRARGVGKTGKKSPEVLVKLANLPNCLTFFTSRHENSKKWLAKLGSEVF